MLVANVRLQIWLCSVRQPNRVTLVWNAYRVLDVSSRKFFVWVVERKGVVIACSICLASFLFISEMLQSYTDTLVACAGFVVSTRDIIIELFNCVKMVGSVEWDCNINVSSLDFAHAHIVVLK